MFKRDIVVGELADPRGTLQLGGISDSECISLHYSGQDGREFSLVYTGRQHASLISIVKKAIELVPNAKPRSTTRLGALPPKPIQLQVVQVTPAQPNPVLILRFLGPDWKQDFATPAQPLLELLEKAKQEAPLPGVVGVLNRFGPGIWMVEGQTLEISDDLSHGTGFYGEYIHHTEVPEGTTVRAWSAQIDGRPVVVTFEYGDAWEPNSNPDLPQGQEGDRLLADGLVRHSRELHARLSKTMYETKRIDPIWAGKVALSSIIGDILMSDDKSGYATWTGKGANPILQRGVKALQEEALTPHDNALFTMISAYYLNKASAPLEQVSQQMEAAWLYAQESEPEMQRLVLNSWYLLLKERGAQEGDSDFRSWEDTRPLYPGEIKPTVFSLPLPFSWVKSVPTTKAVPPADESTAAGAAATLGKTGAPPELPPLTKVPEPIDRALPPDSDEGMPAVDTDPSGSEKIAEPTKTGAGGKSRVPIMAAAAILLIALPVGYYFSQQGGASEPEPTPTVAIETEEAPQANEPPQAAVPPVPSAEPLPPGDLKINGFALNGELRERDIIGAGYQTVESFTDPSGNSAIARYYLPDGGELIANLELPSRRVTALQGDRLIIDSQAVADLQTLPETFKEDSRFRRNRIQAVVDDTGKVRAYTLSMSSFYSPELLIDSPTGFIELSKRIKDSSYFEGLPDGFVSSYTTDGTPLIFSFLGAHENSRLSYLLDQGADPNQQSWGEGNTPLHVVKSVKTAELLIARGADPTLTNDLGQTPAEIAHNEELRVLLSEAAAAHEPEELDDDADELEGEAADLDGEAADAEATSEAEDVESPSLDEPPSDDEPSPDGDDPDGES